MKLNVRLPHSLEIPAFSQPWELNLGHAEVKQAMRLVDELGYNKILLGEHYIIPKAHLSLSGAYWHQATTALAAMASCTDRIKLASGITLLTLQNPIIQAKTWATLDWFSGGRAVPVFAIGWMKGEFDLLRVPFHERGRMCDEYIQAIIALWTQESPSFEGSYVSFHDVGFAPKPIQQHMPIWFGGDSETPWRRIAKWGHGWQPAHMHPKEFPRAMDYIRSQPEYDGRPLGLFFSVEALRVLPGHLETSVEGTEGTWNSQQMVDLCGWLSTFGVTETIIPMPPLNDFDEYLDRLRWVAAEVMPRV